MVAMMNQDAPYSGIAGLMAAKGRYGDTELLHVRPDELAGLASVGQLTVNPDTGLPEAFSFKSLLPAVGAIAGSVLLGPGIGTAIGSGAFGAGIGAGLGSFAGGLAAGQSPTDALIGGLVSGATSGIMAGMMGPSPAALEAGLGIEGSTAAAQTATGSAVTPQAIQAGATVPTAGGNAAVGLSPSGPVSLVPRAAGMSAGEQALVNAARQSASQGFQTVPVTAELAAKSGTSMAAPFAAGEIPAETFVRDFGVKGAVAAQKALEQSGQAPLTTTQMAGALLQRPSTYTPLAFGAVEGLMAPPEFDPNADEGLAALESTYTPRDLKLIGGEFTQGDLSQEDYTRLALEGGLGPALTPFRYVEEDTASLSEGGQPEAEEVDTQVEEDTVASEEKRKQEEVVQKKKAASEVDKFISNTVGGAALGALIQGGLNQDPAATATPYGQGAQPINTGGNFGFSQGGLIGLSVGGRANKGSKKKFTDSVNIPITLQSTMKRLGIKDATPFLEFAQKTKQIESSGGVNRINPNSNARGDFQWMTTVNPKAKKGVHGSVKTAVNRTIDSYKRIGQEIPEWLKTLDSNSTKSTKDLEKNVLSLTPTQELELFFGNIGEAKGSDKYLNKIARGDKEAMYGAYSDIHHTRGREDQPTKRVAIKTFYGDMPEQTQPVVAMGGLTETMTDTRPSELYTVKPGDTLSKLAAKSGMSIRELMDANLSRISDPNKIYAGQQIALSDSPDIANPVPVSEENEEGLMSLIRSYLPDFLTRAEGGQIQPYFEGKVIGPGDGQSDEVLFDVEGDNPDMALLSPDEYVIPADAVAMIGSGSSNAGAKKLDGFVKNIRKEATGNTKQQKPIKQGLESFLA